MVLCSPCSGDVTQPVLNLAAGEQRTLSPPFALLLLRGGIAGKVTLPSSRDVSRDVAALGVRESLWVMVPRAEHEVDDLPLANRLPAQRDVFGGIA